MESPDSRRRIKSVVKAFKIIETIREQTRADLSDIASELDLSKSTCHIYLQTLVDIGYLTKEDGMYKLDLRFLELGSYARYHYDLYTVARPKVDELARETADVVGIGTENHGKRVVLYRAEGQKAVTPIYSRLSLIGEHVPLHWTAIGKSILSQMSDKEIDAIISEFGLPETTSHTITSRDELFDDIERVRERGYALEDEEHKIGSRAIAAPIKGPNGRRSGIAVTGPTNRLSDKRIEQRLSDQVMEYASIISLELTEKGRDTL